MPLDFPNSPTIGQTFSSGTRKWTWTGEQWSAANIIEVPPSSFRNKIINGDMRIDQRNAGASYIPPTGGGLRYTIDRWGVQSQITNSNYITTQQLSLTPPPGFVNYLNITVNTAQTLGSSIFDYYILRQAIEGNNVRDLGWGTSSPKTTTLSFWVRSSLTGLFGGHLTNATSSRFYTFTYNITQANTWQYVTVTIPGDTVGPWSTDTSAGIYVTWVLGVGTGNNAGVPNSWVSYAGGGATPTPVGTTGLTNFLGTQGTTFQITGVQFEVGSIATPFEHRPIGTELALCQRYYYKSPIDFFYDTVGSSYNNLCSIRYAYHINAPLPVEMRAVPNITLSFKGGLGTQYAGNFERTVNSTTFLRWRNGASGFNPNLSGQADMYMSYTADAEL